MLHVEINSWTSHDAIFNYLVASGLYNLAQPFRAWCKISLTAQCDINNSVRQVVHNLYSTIKQVIGLKFLGTVLPDDLGVNIVCLTGYHTGILELLCNITL